MTRDEFEHALALHGGDLSRWPTGLADTARALSERDPSARAALAKAERLDLLLATAMQPSRVDAATVGRIMAGINAKHARDMAVRPTRRLFAWAGAAMAVFLVAGFAIGLAVPSGGSDDDAYAALLFGPDTSASLSVGGIL